MKKTFYTLAIMLALPLATYQTWNILTGILKVYSGDRTSAVCFEGTKDGYDGTCTSPKAPTWDYLEKVRLEEAARRAIK